MRFTLLLLISVLLVAALFSNAYAQTAQEWIERGYEASLSGNIEEAISCYTKALEIEPQNKYAYYARAVIKMQTGDLKGALSDYNKAIEISPNFIEAYIDRAGTKERMGDKKGAKADFEKAEELRKRGVDHALEDINKEIEADPKAAKKILDRGKYKLLERDYKGAVEDFDRITLPAHRLSSRSIALTYEPETVEDQEIINSYGGPSNTPAYLVHLRPVLTVQGERLAEGTGGLPMGEDYTLSMQIISPNGTVYIENTHITGYLSIMGIVSQNAAEPEEIAFEEKNAERLLYEEAIQYIKI